MNYTIGKKSTPPEERELLEETSAIPASEKEMQSDEATEMNAEETVTMATEEAAAEEPTVKETPDPITIEAEIAEIFAEPVEEEVSEGATVFPPQEPEKIKSTAERRRVLYEDEKLRNKNAAHYVNNDRTTTAVFTAKASHYFDKSEGKYKKIDHTLSDKGKFFENTAGEFQARFAKGMPDGKIYEMTKNDSKITLVSEQLHTCEHTEGCTCEGDSKVMLHHVTPNADIEYITEVDRVKENIIIKEKADEYVFDFSIATENLYAGISEDGKNLELKNKATNEVEFMIPPPFMFDAKKNYSDDVYYEIESETDDLIQLKVVASAEFINAPGRAFPVIIDPQVITDIQKVDYEVRYYGEFWLGVGFAFGEMLFTSVPADYDPQAAISDDGSTDFWKKTNAAAEVEDTHEGA